MLNLSPRFHRAKLSKSSINNYKNNNRNCQSNEVQNLVTTSNVDVSLKSEFIGFRRLAKLYSRSVSHWSEYILNRRIQLAKNHNQEQNLAANLQPNLQPKILGNENYERETIDKSDVNDDVFLDNGRYREINNRGLSLNLNFGNKFTAYDHNKYSLTLNTHDKIDQRRKSRDLKKNETTLASWGLFPKNSEDTLRVLVMKNIPAKVGIDSIMSQIYGGPLERLILHHDLKSSWAEISFIKPHHAQQYYNYGTKTGLLIINGIKLTLEWADASNTENMTNEHPPISKYLLNEIDNHGSRRCLIFTKDVFQKNLIKSTNKLHYPDPKIHLSKGVNFRNIKRDFGHFGELVSINPVISKKLSFSIVFADIRSTIIAKRVCETKGTKMNSCYGDWNIEYGKDSADRPCLTV